MNHDQATAKNNAPKNSIQVEAKTEEQALVIASGRLGVSQEGLEYKVVKKSGGGLFSFFSPSKVEILAWRKETRDGRGENRDNRDGNRDRSRKGGYSNNYSSKQSKNDGNRNENSRNDGRSDNPRVESNRIENQNQNRNAQQPRKDNRRDNSAPRPQHNAQNNVDAVPLSPEAVESLKQELKQFCEELCGRIAGEPVETKIDLQGDKLILDIQNEHMQELIKNNVKLAESIEHLIRKKPRHLKQELPFKIFLDANGNRKSREEELAQLAQDISSQVHENQKPVVLNYKSSYDRKIIHMALEKDDRVFTKSIGSGSNRKLMILPASDASKEAST